MTFSEKPWQTYGQSGQQTPLRRSSSKAWRRCSLPASRMGLHLGSGWPDVPPQNSSAPPTLWSQNTSCRSSVRKIGGLVVGHSQWEKGRGVKEKKKGENQWGWSENRRTQWAGDALSKPILYVDGLKIVYAVWSWSTQIAFYIFKENTFKWWFQTFTQDYHFLLVVVLTWNV